MVWHHACPLLLVFAAMAAAAPTEKPTVNLLMPKVRPSTNDEMLCTAVKVDKPTFITSFVPHAKMNTAHHMLLFACSEPGSKQKTWNCGEMMSEKVKTHDDYKYAPTCAGQMRIIYAWGRDAPPLKLPKDVSFEVGGNSGTSHLVLQVHYKNASKFIKDKSATDESGVEMSYSAKPTPKVGGVYTFLTSGFIPPHSTVFMETACSYNHRPKLHPFAFRTHAHKLGQVVSAYRVRKGKWTEIGRKSPQLPQMFYNITNPGMVIEKGDHLAARCVMKNNRDKRVSIGSTQKDEMCNFYMMYWVPQADAKVLQEEDMEGCGSDGWPSFKWKDIDQLLVKNAPITAAMIPGSKTVFAENLDRSKYLQQMIAEEQLALARASKEVMSALNSARDAERDMESEFLGETPEEDYFDQDEDTRVERRGVPFFDPDGDEGYEEEIDPVAHSMW